MSETALILNVCSDCDRADRDEKQTADEMIDHMARMLEDQAVLQALKMIHGERQGVIDYLRKGGLMHMSMEEARAWAGLSKEEI